MELNPPPSPLDMTNLQENLPGSATMPYFQAFLTDNPRKAFESVQLRLKRAKILNHDITTYFQDRAKVEDDYVRGLQRLAAKTYVSDKNSLCTFANAWDTLFNELHEIIKIHSFFIAKISEEVEVPLREKVTSDPEWSQLKNYESNLGKLTREYEDKLQKVNKHRSKSKTSKKTDTIENKLVESQKALGETKAELQKNWSTYLEKAQAIDLTRWVDLKETIARFETIQADVCQKRVEMAERTLGTVVDFDVQGEIEDFCSKKGFLIEGSIDDSLPSGTVNQLKSAFSIRRKRVTSQNYSEATFQTRMESTDSHSDGLRSPSSSSFNNEISSPNEAAVPKVVVDPEGYSIPPPEPKWDNFSSSNEENDSDTRSDAASSSQEKMRVEIKPTVAPINEEEAAAAMSLVMTHLKSAPTAKKSTLRGRKDQWRSTIMNTDSIYVDTNTASRTSSLINSSPTSYEFPETANHARAVSDSETQSRGLRASISETVNIMSKGGEVTKILVTGEISIKYHFPTIRDHSHPIRIRIKNFETLEKSAPNTSYIRPVPDCVGQYDIDTGLLSLASGTSVVIMKYQARINPESRNAYVPLQVILHWKCEPNLTSLALSYQVNPECKLTGNLSELSFMVPVDGQVGSVQSKPSGVWSVEKQRMYWQVDDGIDLSTPSEQKKILARFETEKTSNPAPAAVRFFCKGQLLSDISIEVVPSVPNGNDIKEQESDSLREFENDFKLQEISCQVSSGKFIALP